jgi:hypothetical protein
MSNTTINRYRFILRNRIDREFVRGDMRNVAEP